ncbi:MAG: 50S ribosomal protein L6 [Candidatus Tectomicrobia bacterium]|nr:50S ribosomal protein L6 [Candidatus Tectomicrobia bacterium]
MSRVGRLPIALPTEVEATISQEVVEVKGKRGTLSHKIPHGIRVALTDHQLLVERSSDSKSDKALHGLTRSLLANMVRGVSEGFAKQLEINGIGYRAQLQGKTLSLNLGYTSPKTTVAPEGIEFEVDQRNIVVIRGADKQLVGQVAANIRNLRAPEPYKGKGIKYSTERIRRKEGKTGS